MHLRPVDKVGTTFYTLTLGFGHSNPDHTFRGYLLKSRKTDNKSLTRQNAAQAFRQSEGFEKLSVEEIDELACETKTALYKKGEIIFREDDPTDFLYLVQEGLVRLYKMTPSGVELTLTVAGHADTLNSAALFLGAHYASAQALSEVTILMVTRQSFFTFLAHHPHAIIEITTVLARRIRKGDSRAISMLGIDVQARIATSLMSLAAKFGAKLPFSQKEIANCAGTTTETTSRVLSHLKEQGIIAYTPKRRIILLSDMKKLGQLAYSDEGWI